MRKVVKHCKLDIVKWHFQHFEPFQQAGQQRWQGCGHWPAGSASTGANSFAGQCGRFVRCEASSNFPRRQGSPAQSAVQLRRGHAVHVAVDRRRRQHCCNCGQQRFVDIEARFVFQIQAAQRWSPPPPPSPSPPQPPGRGVR
ncbi:conserved hypothetical protein [Trichinella spiralis]|uniref:hypothetical protein n=1 Tax=Trichinella spiralis TaxID=6334 RepID=UPI0001EFBF1C|nr:conserved hypothetical protein [Trichinella spiralis]